MSVISITTTQNIEIEYELGSLGDRIVARIVDLLIVAAYALLIFAIIGFANSSSFIDNNPVVFFIVVLLPIVFYDLVFEILMNGQSIGKKIMAIKVISLKGEQPTLSQYIIRWLFRLLDFTISSGLVALISVAATEKNQRIGDLVANTTLVKIKPRAGLQQTLYVPTIDTNYVVTYPQVINLNDSDVQLIKEVLIAVQKTRNGYLAFQAARKIEETLHIQMQSEASQFLYTVIADYNHLANRQ